MSHVLVMEECVTANGSQHVLTLAPSQFSHPALHAQQATAQALTARYVISLSHAMQDTAHWLMDQEDLANCEAAWRACQERKQRDAAENARKEKEHRKQLLAKYHLQVVGTTTINEAQKVQQAPKNKVS